MTKEIEDAVNKAKELVEKLNLEEPYKSLTYSKLLEKSLQESTFQPTTEITVSEEIAEKYPSGLQGRILELKNKDQIFIQKRTVSDIQKILAEKGFIHEITDVAVALLRLVRKGHLRRIRENQDGKEIFLYVNP